MKELNAILLKFVIGDPLTLPYVLILQDSQWDYECVLILEGRTLITDAFVEIDTLDQSNYYITCQLHQVSISENLDCDRHGKSSLGPLNPKTIAWPTAVFYKAFITMPIETY